MATRIIWSGLTGSVGLNAMRAAAIMPDVDIVIGVSRRDMSDIESINGQKFEDVKWKQYGQICCDQVDYLSIEKCVDVMVDFSDASVFDEVLRVATRIRKPLVIGTSNLSKRQKGRLLEATQQIPIFYSENYRFGVKRFIDEAVELAKKHRKHEGKYELYENLHKGEAMPSEVAKNLQRRVREATGREVKVRSSICYYGNTWINYREFYAHYQNSSKTMSHEECNHIAANYGEVAHAALEITKIMANKPVMEGKFYDLDGIWDEIPETVRMK